MRIGFNARLLGAPTVRGWNRYTINLLEQLAELGIEVVLYSDRPLVEAHLQRLRAGTYRVRVAPQMRYASWEQWWLPRQCARDRVDVLHSPCNFGLPWSSPCPRVLTIHDAIDQAYYAPRTPLRDRWSTGAIRSRLHHWTARRRADRVITGSEHAKADLVRVLGLAPDRITVIHDAAEARFQATPDAADRSRVRGDHGLGRPYVFYVGGWEQRKNLPFLLRAFAAAGLEGVELVLGGGTDAQRQELSALARSLGIADQTRLLGWLPDEDLPVLYAEALCFVNPSEYEGFGLQLCEAMAAGCPTLAARATSLPEIVGDGGLTFSLADEAELASLLRSLATDAAHRSRLSAAAQHRATEFSWTRTARQTVEVYRCLLEDA